MYLISAYFDEHTTRQLNRFINTIAQNTGNTYMVDNNVPPHMTISSFEMREPSNLIEDFESLKYLQKGDINIISVGSFMPYVMYASPVLNQYLQELSQNIYNKISVRDDVSINKCYKPYSWFPHITLGKKLDKQQMIKAYDTMQVYFMPLNGSIERLGLAQTNPHKDISVIELG